MSKRYNGIKFLNFHLNISCFIHYKFCNHSLNKDNSIKMNSFKIKKNFGNKILLNQVVYNSSLISLIKKYSLIKSKIYKFIKYNQYHIFREF